MRVPKRIERVKGLAAIMPSYCPSTADGKKTDGVEIYIQETSPIADDSESLIYQIAQSQLQVRAASNLHSQNIRKRHAT